LWPESGERRGRAALRSALSGLRKTLEEAIEEPQHYLVTDGGSLGLAFGPDPEFDLHALGAAYALARSNPRRTISKTTPATCSPETVARV
jgi:DNA-binding SARP family transcriptional activator